MQALLQDLKAYFDAKRDQPRHQVTDDNRTVWRLKDIAQKVFELHFPGVEPSVVRFFWNNDDLEKKPMGYMGRTMDAQFEVAGDAVTSVFMVEMCMTRGSNIVDVRWGFPTSQRPQYGPGWLPLRETYGQTEVVLPSPL